MSLVGAGSGRGSWAPATCTQQTRRTAPTVAVTVAVVRRQLGESVTMASSGTRLRAKRGPTLKTAGFFSAGRASANFSRAGAKGEGERGIGQAHDSHTFFVTVGRSRLLASLVVPAAPSSCARG